VAESSDVSEAAVEQLIDKLTVESTTSEIESVSSGVITEDSNVETVFTSAENTAAATADEVTAGVDA
jgi:hypothetical protein